MLFLCAGPIFAGGASEQQSSDSQAGTAATDSQTLSVYVSILPQQEIVNKIGGDTVEVSVLVEPGDSPHTYDPSPKEIMTVAAADVYFTLGLPFEKQISDKLKKATGVRMFPMDSGIRRRHLEEEHKHDDDDTDGSEAHHDNNLDAENNGGEQHATYDDESHEEQDPHIWLSPANLERMAENCYQGLSNLHPEKEAFYRSKKEAFIQELETIDKRIASILKPFEGEPLFVYHAAFGYFAEYYGLEQKPVEIQGKQPTPKHITEIIREAKETGSKILFVQPQFDTKSAQKIAEAIGGAVVSIDPLAPDVLENLEQIATAIEQALQ